MEELLDGAPIASLAFELDFDSDWISLPCDFCINAVVTLASEVVVTTVCSSIWGRRAVVVVRLATDGNSVCGR